VDTGKVEQAVPLLRDALKTNGNNAAAHWELGYAYRFAGMLDESVAECERTRQLGPLIKSNGSVLNTYLYLGQYQKFLESLPVDDSSFTLFYRGFGEFHVRRFDQAAKDFDHAYELDPTLYTGIGKAPIRGQRKFEKQVSQNNYLRVERAYRSVAVSRWRTL
jgi:tetratricopeptide (TPR) repeat protein